MSATAAPKKKVWEYVVIGLIVIVIGGGIAVGGFYQDEVGSYIRVQGWSLGQYEEATKSLVKSANAGDSAATAALMHPQTAVTLLKKNGAVSGVQLKVRRDMKDYTLKELCPTASPKLGAPNIVSQSGEVSVKARFPEFVLDFRWTQAGGPKLSNIIWVPSEAEKG